MNNGTLRRQKKCGTNNLVNSITDTRTRTWTMLFLGEIPTPCTEARKRWSLLCHQHCHSGLKTCCCDIPQNQGKKKKPERLTSHSLPSTSHLARAPYSIEQLQRVTLCVPRKYCDIWGKAFCIQIFCHPANPLQTPPEGVHQIKVDCYNKETGYNFRLQERVF